MKSKLEYEKIAQKMPNHRYQKQEYVNMLKKEVNRAKAAGSMMGIVISKYPFYTGKEEKTEDFPLVIMGVDAHKDFKKFAKKLVMNKEESLAGELDLKAVALVEFMKFDETAQVFETKFIKTKGSPNKIIKTFNKKLKRFCKLELWVDEGSQAEQDFLEETETTEKSAISVSDIQKHLKSFSTEADEANRLKLAQKIVTDCDTWLHEFEKRQAGKAKKLLKKVSLTEQDRKLQSYVLDLKAKFERRVMKVSLNNDLAGLSALSEEQAEEWVELYTEIKIEHDQYFTQDDMSLDIFPLEERKDYLENTIADIRDWRKLYAAIGDLSKLDDKQKDVLQKQEVKIDEISKNLELALDEVNKQLPIESALGKLRKDLSTYQQIFNSATDNSKKLMAMMNMLTIAQKLEKELPVFNK